MTGYRIWLLLPERFRWAPHNLLAHPAGEVLFWFGLEAVSNKIHDVTIPYHLPGTGRG